MAGENARENGMAEFTHFDEQGNAYMVDVGEKDVTHREALASGVIRMSDEAYQAVLGKKIRKGDVFTVAQVAGIMGVKRTPELIPMCHTLLLTNAKIRFETDDGERSICVLCSVKCEGKTGVEMEALTGAVVALLTIYDMCKAIDRTMEIGEIRLLEKSGGKSGHFVRKAGTPGISAEA